MASNPKPPPTAIDSQFKHIVIFSTALSIAIFYGWLAGFVREPDGGFRFHWRWPQFVWAVIGYLSTAYFWHQAWPAKDQAAVTRKGFFKGTIVFALPCLWWVTLPLRSDSGQHLKDLLTGIFAAAIVLSFVFWMIFRLFNAFEKTDKYDLEHLDLNDRNKDSKSNENGDQ